MRSLFLVFLSLLFSLHATNCQAEPDLKEFVFKNCDKASDLLHSSLESKSAEYLSYLREVLKLKIATSPDTISMGNLPHSVPGGSDADMSRLWVSMNPEREYGAKRCAIRLLKELSPKSWASTEELLEITADPSLPLDIINSARDALYQLTFDISRNPDSSPIDVIAKKALDFLPQDGHNVLAFLPPQRVVPLVIDYLWKAPETELGALSNFVEWYTPGHPLLSEQIISGLSPQGGPTELTKVNRALIALGHITCPSQELADFALSLVASENEGIINAVTTALLNWANHLGGKSVCIADSAHFSGTDFFNLITRLGEDRDGTTRALDAKVSTLLSKALLPLLHGRNPTKAFPIISKALTVPGSKPFEDHPGFLALLASDSHSFGLISDVLKGNDQESRAIAAFALQRISAKDIDRANLCLQYFADNNRNVRESCVDILLNVGKPLRTEMSRRIVTKNMTGSRSILAAILAHHGYTASPITSILKEANHGTDCNGLGLTSVAAYSLKLLPKEQIFQRIKSCLDRESSRIRELSYILDNEPSLAGDIEPLVKNIVSDPSLTPEAISQIVSSLGNNWHFVGQESITRMIRGVTPASLKRVFDFISFSPDEVRIYADIVGSRIVDSATSDSLRCQLLSKLSTQPDILSRALVDSFDKEVWKDTACLSQIKNPDLADIVSSRLAHCSRQKKWFYLRALGNLGDSSIKFTDSIDSFISERDLKTQYEAIVAGLRVATDFEKYFSLLRTTMRTPLNWWIPYEQFPEKINKEVGAIAVSTHDILEQLTANMYLNRQ